MSKRSSSRELCTIDKTGKVSDAELHEEILNNPEADRALSKMAIERAIAGGWDPERAQRAFGIADAG